MRMKVLRRKGAMRRSLASRDVGGQEQGWGGPCWWGLDLGYSKRVVRVERRRTGLAESEQGKVN